MSGPAPGFYRLVNYQTNYTVTTKTNDEDVAQPGCPIRTEKGADRTYPEHSRLIVSKESGGQYVFRNLTTKMFIGCGQDEHGNAVAAWTPTAQTWDVDPVASGTWTISMPGAADSFWFDSTIGNHPRSKIMLKESRARVQYYWYFVAA
ncbi:hypothetical protein CVT24_006618 [Panaeolus cyanescens]|uniref:Ricin B lectin domain-containing protein n=1 Tax=Panaeolus cyanescens TaxID=181874 RepID=A0A409YS95_9AGAR|nr:hypothetical protein CVT24_006618 [Panaeolus cyanescens]